MLRIYIENCKWGADETEDGLQFNFLDEKSETMLHIPFNEEAITAMQEIIENHKQEQK